MKFKRLLCKIFGHRLGKETHKTVEYATMGNGMPYYGKKSKKSRQKKVVRTFRKCRRCGAMIMVEKTKQILIMSRLQITTNEWIDATKQKPWTMRLVLVRNSDDTKGLAYWDGTDWLTQGGSPYRGDITHFYVFERYIPRDDNGE